jgi:threonine dehydrogenase-like Zn-dependent dehydrogenase
MRVPAYTLVPLPDELSFSTGAAISCGTGTAYQALRRVNLTGGDTIAIVGQGPVGLSATQLAVAMGARVIALDVSAERLKRAKEFGADALIDAKAGDTPAAIKELTHGTGADLTLDTSGTAPGRLIAVRGARKWGTTCFVGEGGDVTIEVSPDMLRKQLTIVGLVDFFHHHPGGLRALCRRSQDRRRSSVHRSLAACPGRRSLQAVRPPNERQGRVLDQLSAA